MSDDGESSSAGASRMQRLREGVAQQFAPGVLVRLQYASYLFMGLLVCLLLKGSVGRAMSSVHYLQKGCIYADAAPATPGGSDIFHQASSSLATYASHVCYGNTFVYRVSFALLIFFTIMFLSVSDLSCCIDDKTRAEFQGRFFCWKSALLTLINFLMMWVPNEFFATYAWVCMIVSGIFLVVQVMLLVDFSYVWSEEWSARSDENNKWQWYLAAVAFLCYASGIGLTIHSFFMYVPSSSCNMHGFVLTINVLAAILYTSVAIWVPHGSIVPSGILFSYTSFLVFTALRLDSEASCNLMGPADGSIKTTLVAAVVSAVALAYSVVSCGGTDSAESLALTSNEGGVANAADADEALPSSRRFTTAIGHLPGYCFFYLIMMAGSMYLAMLGTDWQISGNSSYDATTPNNHGSQVAMWVKLATSWLTIAMYLWSLLAPYYCCRDRDFGYDIPTDW